MGQSTRAGDLHAIGEPAGPAGQTRPCVVRAGARQDLKSFIKKQNEAAEKRRRKAEAGRAASKTGASTEDEEEDDKQAPLRGPSPPAPRRGGWHYAALCQQCQSFVT